MAAQSARDRKKARMTELEQQVVELEEEVWGWGAGGAGGGRGRRCGLLPDSSLQNQKLLLENRLLREKTCSLALENQELRCRLGLGALKTEEESESEVSLLPRWWCVFISFWAELAESCRAPGGACVAAGGEG